MTVEVATVTGHYNLFEALRTLVKSVGVAWTEVEYDNSTPNRLVWFKIPGPTAQQGLYVGWRTYQDISADYYNISFFGAIGHVPGNAYNTQPGFSNEKTICCWDQSIKYWAVATTTHLRFGAKIQNVEEPVYIGKPLIYADYGQYPYPLFVGASLDDIPATRYSDTARNAFFKSGGAAPVVLRFTDGTWLNPELWPFTSQTLDNGGGDVRTLRNTANTSETAVGPYALLPIILTNSANVFGELEGMFFISGFDNAMENTLTIGGTPYVVLRNIWRTGFEDYIALRLG